MFRDYNDKGELELPTARYVKRGERTRKTMASRRRHQKTRTLAVPRCFLLPFPSTPCRPSVRPSVRVRTFLLRIGWPHPRIPTPTTAQRSTRPSWSPSRSVHRTTRTLALARLLGCVVRALAVAVAVVVRLVTSTSHSYSSITLALTHRPRTRAMATATRASLRTKLPR